MEFVFALLETLVLPLEKNLKSDFVFRKAKWPKLKPEISYSELTSSSQTKEDRKLLWRTSIDRKTHFLSLENSFKSAA